MRLVSKCFLSMALLASISLVGCGGGGSSDPVAPKVDTLAETKAAQAVVSPIVKNADSILNGGLSLPTAIRGAIGGDAELVDLNELNGVVANLLGATRASSYATYGGYLDDSLLWGNGSLYSGHGYWVATYSNNVYERTRYRWDHNSNEDIVDAVYRIKNCSATVDKEGKLTSLVINKGTTFEINDENWVWSSYDPTTYTDTYVKSSITKVEGTFNAPITCKIDITSKDINPEKKVYTWDFSREINANDSYGYQPLREETWKKTYDFSKGLDMTINSYTYQSIKENGYTITGDLNIKTSGFTGVPTSETKYKVCYCREKEWDQETYEYKDNWIVFDEPYYFQSDSTVRNNNVSVVTPVTLTLNNVTGKTDKSNAKIKNIIVQINKLTKANDLKNYEVTDAEAHIALEAEYKEKTISIGTKDLGATTVKIDITGLQGKNNSKAADVIAKAKANLEAKDITNNVTITADYVYATKKANINIVNDGNTEVKDRESGIQFSFKTVEAKAENVDVTEKNCEGSRIEVVGVEKDGAISKRSYIVKDGNLVLDKQNDRIHVEVPQEIKNKTGEEIAKAAEEKATTPITQEDSTATMKVGTLGDGSATVATFDKPASGDNKYVKINATAKDKVILSVGFYGTDFTIVFAFDTVENTIEGSVLKGKVPNATFEDKKANPVATFAGSDGKVTVYTSGAKTEFEVK